MIQEESDDASGIDVADPRQAGFNFYRFRPFGYGVVSTNDFSVADSVLTIDQSDFAANHQLQSSCGIGCGAWLGYSALGDAYFEARVRNVASNFSYTSARA